MKRIFTLIAVIGLTMAAFAQHPLATLSHDGNLTFFSNLSALESALDAAEDGDIIYLSEGIFATNSGKLTIDKKVSIIGTGYKSRIIPSIYVDMLNNASDTIANPMFDGVRISVLEFYGHNTSRANLKEVTVRKCWIRELKNGGYAGKDFFIDRCYIETVEFSGASDNNTYVQNSKIGEIKSSGYPEGINVTNCNIKKTSYCPRSVTSSIIESATNYSGYFATSGDHSIYRSLMPSNSIHSSGTVYADNCYYDDNDGGGLLDDNLEPLIDLKEKGYFGADGGTVVGIYGGETPFSVNPSVPTVDSANSSVEYDAEANKLNVTITVAPN